MMSSVTICTLNLLLLVLLYYCVFSVMLNSAKICRLCNPPVRDEKCEYAGRRECRERLLGRSRHRW
jgi:hypothetical protein